MKSRIREILALFLQCSGTFFKLNVSSLATTSPTPLSPHLNQSTLPINSPISKRPSKLLTFSIHCAVEELWHLLWQCGSLLGSGIFALLCPDNRQPLSPPFTPPFGMVLVISLAPPSLKWLSSLAAGAKLEWHGERVQCDSVPLPH